MRAPPLLQVTWKPTPKSTWKPTWNYQNCSNEWRRRATGPAHWQVAIWAAHLTDTYCTLFTIQQHLAAQRHPLAANAANFRLVPSLARWHPLTPSSHRHISIPSPHHRPDQIFAPDSPPPSPLPSNISKISWNTSVKKHGVEKQHQPPPPPTSTTKKKKAQN